MFPHIGPPPAGLAPGAVVLIEQEGATVLNQSFGYAETQFDGQAHSGPRPMLPDTVFDLASVTKVCVTTTAIMRLVADRELALDQPVGEFVVEFREKSKAGIRLRDLLAHRGGLWEWWPLYVEADDREGAVRAAARLRFGIRWARSGTIRISR